MNSVEKSEVGSEEGNHENKKFKELLFNWDFNSVNEENKGTRVSLKYSMASFVGLMRVRRGLGDVQ